MNDKKHPIAMINEMGEEIARYDSVAQAKRKSGYTKNQILSSIKGNRPDDLVKFKSLL